MAASAAEAELGELFINTQEARIIRLMFREIGHPQLPTSIHIDSTTAVRVVNNTIKRERSRSMEMQYFWLLDQQAQKHFKFAYQPGQDNMGYYQKKRHTDAMHRHVIPYYLRVSNSPTTLLPATKPSARRGCAETLGDPYHKQIPLPSIPDYRAREATT